MQCELHRFFQEKIQEPPEPGWLELRWVLSCPRIRDVLCKELRETQCTLQLWMAMDSLVCVVCFACFPVLSFVANQVILSTNEISIIFNHRCERGRCLGSLGAFSTEAEGRRRRFSLCVMWPPWPAVCPQRLLVDLSGFEGRGCRPIQHRMAQ